MLAIVVASVLCPQAILVPDAASLARQRQAGAVLQTIAESCQPVGILSPDYTLPRTAWYHGNGSAPQFFVGNHRHIPPSDSLAASLADASASPPRTSGPLIVLHCLLTI